MVKFIFSNKTIDDRTVNSIESYEAGDIVVTRSGVIDIYTKTTDNKLTINGSIVEVDGVDFDYEVKSIDCRTIDVKDLSQKIVCLIMPANNQIIEIEINLTFVNELN